MFAQKLGKTCIITQIYTQTGQLDSARIEVCSKLYFPNAKKVAGVIFLLTGKYAKNNKNTQ